MKTFVATMCCAVACSVAALAQTPPATPAATGQMDKKDGNVIITGCVARGDTEGQFKLTNAMKSDAKDKTKMSSEPAQPAGTSGTPAPAGMALSYEIVGGEELKAHVGHKVEVTGTTDTTHKMSETDKSDKDKAAHKDMQGGKLTLKSFKMLSAVCP